MPPSEVTSGVQDPAILFVLRLAQALHSSGYAAHSLEDILRHVCDQLGLIGQFFTTPTAIMAGFGPLDNQHTFLIRVQPGELNLGRLSALDQVAHLVAAGQLSPGEGSARIATILTKKPTYPWWLRVAGYGIVSAAGCQFLGGGRTDVEVGMGVGLLIGLLALLFRRLTITTHVFELTASFVASAVVTWLAATGLHLSVPTTTLAGIITLLPGLTVTVAMTELASRHLSSGTARLGAAFIVFASMAFGVALGTSVVTELHGGPVHAAAATALPAWARYVALAFAPLGLCAAAARASARHPAGVCRQPAGICELPVRRGTPRPGARSLDRRAVCRPVEQPDRAREIRTGLGRARPGRAAARAGQHWLPQPHARAQSERRDGIGDRHHRGADRFRPRGWADRCERARAACKVITQMDTPPTKRATVRQKPQRAHYDRETVNAILDEGLLCHVGFIVEGAPIVIPTGFARDGDRLLLHGGAASRLMGQLGEGVDVSIAVTLVDGLVLADVAFRHSMNYRSVVLFGRARAITDPAEKQRALRAFAEHIVPGRWSDLPAPTPQELGATAVVEVPIDEVSAKIRSGPPIEGATPPAPTLWTGTASFATSISGFTPDARSEALPVPEYLARWRRGAGII